MLASEVLYLYNVTFVTELLRGERWRAIFVSETRWRCFVSSVNNYLSESTMNITSAISVKSTISSVSGATERLNVKTKTCMIV